MNVKFIYRWRTVEITDDPSSEYDLPVKIIIDGQDRTAVWWLCDRGMPAEEFAKRFIDMEAVLKEAQAAKDADEAKTQFEYKGCQVEITDDLILLDGKDYTPFYKGSNEPPEAWIKGHIDAQARSRLEFQIRDIELKNKAERAETAKKAEEKERTKALEAKIGITLDELKRLPAPARAKLDELIAEKLKASYAAEEAQKVAKAKAAEADRAIREARATEAADEAGKKWRRFLGREKNPRARPYRAQANGNGTRC